MSRTLNLCAHVLPSGSTCRQVTLCGDTFCRHHRRNLRHIEHSQIHEEAMQDLRDGLDSMELSDLLSTLLHNLNQLRRSMRGCPEVQVMLNAAIERLKETGKPENEPASGLRMDLSRLSPGQINDLLQQVMNQ